MEDLLLYFNELCLSPLPDEPGREAQWDACVTEFVNAVDCVLSIRPECRIAFAPGAWHADCGGCPLSERVRQGMRGAKSRYLRLLQKIRHLSNENIILEREVQFSGQTTVGLTLADIAASRWTHGWALSLPFDNSAWRGHQLPAQRFLLNEQGELDGPTDCDIGHLSVSSHVTHWNLAIQDWGAKVAQSSFLGLVDGHPVVMYSAPLEHNPPHVHLLESPNSHNTLAKYEIEQFARPKGPPTWDKQMEEWIERHREQLLRSWARCQRGMHPYELS